MPVNGAELIISAVFFVFFYVGPVLWFLLFRTRRTHPKWILRQLQKSSGPVKVAVGHFGGTWNPKPGGSGRVFGSGKAIYSLDESSVVHLHVLPKRGREQNYSGPLPESVPADSAHLLKQRRIMRLVLVAYGLTVIVGFAAGYLLARGTPGARFVWGLLGVFIAWMVLWLVMLALRVGTSVRKIRGNGP